MIFYRSAKQEIKAVRNLKERTVIDNSKMLELAQLFGVDQFPLVKMTLQQSLVLGVAVGLSVAV